MSVVRDMWNSLDGYPYALVETKKMAGQIAELNSIYARMIEAMSARVAPVGQ